MPDDLREAHRKLDAAVETTYGVNFQGDEEKIVAHLFKLYAEASGVAEATAESAFYAAKAAGDYRRACGAVRRVIPWESVYNALVSTGKFDPSGKLFRKTRR